METLERRDRFLMILLMLSMFSTSWLIAKSPTEIYGGYIIIILLLPGFIGRYGIPTEFWIFGGFFAFTAMFNIFLDNDTTAQFLKIFIGVMVSYLFYYYAIRRFDYDTELIFRYYLKASWVITVIGAIQFVSYLAHFRYGYDFRWLPFFTKWGVITGGNLGIRINSVFGEPSTYAAVMSPAAFIGVYNIVSFRNYVFKYWQSCVVVGVYLFTFSSLGYMGLFIIIILLLINFGFVRYLLLFVPVLFGAFFYLYNSVPDFKIRWDSTIYLFRTGNVDIFEEHGSSIVFYNNYVVATENFKRNFLFGTGLGSHPVAFDKYSVTKDIKTFGFANNNSDANSMLLRIISEIGLIGVVFVFVFLRRHVIWRSGANEDSPHWLISAAILCMMSLYLLRQGHYFLNGFPLFVMLFYFNRKVYDDWLLKKVAAVQADEEEQEEPGEEGMKNENE